MKITSESTTFEAHQLNRIICLNFSVRVQGARHQEATRRYYRIRRRRQGGPAAKEGTVDSRSVLASGSEISNCV